MQRRDKRRPARPNAKGRSDKSRRFVMLTFDMLESVAFASLDLPARQLLQELVMLYRGDNNGSLYLSVRDATARLGLSDTKPVQRAFADLQDRGFIAIAKDGHFSVKASDTCRARSWRLTWEAWPECPNRAKRAPTNEWRAYSLPAGPAGQRADRRLRTLDKYRKARASGQMPVVDSSTLEPKMPQNAPATVEDSTTAIPENRRNQPFLSVEESTTHIYLTMGSSVSAWWRSDREAQKLANLLALASLARIGSETESRRRAA